jgi:hypothetical protein
MSVRALRLTALLLYVAAASIIVWLWISSPTRAPSVQFRRGVFLTDLLIGAALLSQGRFLQLKGSNRGGRLVVAIGAVVILAGVVSALMWIGGQS